MTVFALPLALSLSAFAADPPAAPSAPDAAAAAAASAPSEKPKPTVNLSGIVYAHWGLDLTEGANLASAFDLDRAYVRADGKLDDHWSTRVTLDANRQKAAELELTDATGAPIVVEVPEDARLRVFVKHAWLAYKGGDVKLRAGVIDTTYVPGTEQFLGTRWLSKMALDEVKWQSTADIGVAGSGEHKDGLISWAAGVFNGEGFAEPEINGGKAVQARVTVDGLASGKKLNLPVSAFVEEELNGKGTDSTLTWAASAGFKHENFVTLAEYGMRTTGDVTGTSLSVTAMPKVPDVLGILARLDQYDPDGNVDEDGSMKVIGGLTHDFAEKIGVAAQYERVQFQDAAAVPEHGIFVRMQAGF